jgi:hypothetical protein
MKESEIRPHDIFNEYLSLAERDIKDYFSGCDYSEIVCPACGHAGETAFVKKNFEYKHCEVCKTLFVSPRPDKKAFIEYYRDAPSTRYWAEQFYRKTEKARRKKVYAPRAKNILQKIKKHAPDAGYLVDIGAGYGVFLEEFSKLMTEDFSCMAIEPSDSLSKICSDKGFLLIKKFMEEINRNDIGPCVNLTGVYTSFELLEHVYNPREFLRACAAVMSDNDILIFTTLSGTGFDIQLLWENSKSVFPPHHLNFFNPVSVQTLLENAGFDMLEVCTPGKLDVDIVINNVKYLDKGFFRTFFELSNEKQRKALQIFLRNNNLSSHMMAIARKKKGKT